MVFLMCDTLKRRPVLFLIIVYQPTSGAVRGLLANLKIAAFDGERQRRPGTDGTGFSDAVAAALRKRLDGIIASRCAVARLRARAPYGCRRTQRSRSPIAA